MTPTRPITRLLLSCLALNACADDSRERNAALDFEPRTEPGLELRMTLDQDTVVAGSHDPVFVMFWIVNGPERIVFDNDPLLFGAWLETPDGRVLDPVVSDPPPSGSPGDEVKMVLPAGAILGQRIDLRCFPINGYADLEIQTECLAVLDLNTPGTYHVIGRYYFPATDEGLAENRKEPPHLADTISIVVVR